MHDGLNEPMVTIGPLQVWVRGRQFPEAEDYWDGNWLDVVAVCKSPGATVTAEGSILHLGEVHRFLSACETLLRELKGGAALECMEPNLGVQLEADKLGHISVRVEITPDHMTERHRFDGMIDQTYLPPIITACRRLLDDYPIRDPEEGGI